MKIRFLNRSSVIPVLVAVYRNKHQVFCLSFFTMLTSKLNNTFDRQLSLNETFMLLIYTQLEQYGSNQCQKIFCWIVFKQTYLQTEMDSCLCLAWPSVYVCLCVGWKYMPWRQCPRGHTHSKERSSVAHEGQTITSSLQTAFCQQTHYCCLHYSHVPQQVSNSVFKAYGLKNVKWISVAPLQSAGISFAKVLKTSAQCTVRCHVSRQEVKDGKLL